jgi:hypothetical protein
MSKLLFFLLPIITYFSPHKGCDKITIDSNRYITNVTNQYTLKGFGRIPFDTIHYKYGTNTPFTIGDNCLAFTIDHMGCGCTYELIWTGQYRYEGDKTIADIKFILRWTDPCKMLSITNLSYNISEIINNNKSNNLYLNFDGYGLIKIK